MARQMADVEKVVEGLNKCLVVSGFCDGCPYQDCDGDGKQYRDCIDKLRTDVLGLLEKYRELQERHRILVDCADNMVLALKERTKVVRCEDCKYHLEHTCQIWTDGVYDPAWFCADGEEKDE